MSTSETAADLAVVESNVATNESRIHEWEATEQRLKEQIGAALVAGDTALVTKLKQERTKIQGALDDLYNAKPVWERELQAARLKHRDAVTAEQRARIETLSEAVTSAADDYDGALRAFTTARQKFTAARLALVNEARTDGFDTGTISVDPLPSFTDQPLADQWRVRMQVFGRYEQLPPASGIVPRKYSWEFTVLPEQAEARLAALANTESPSELGVFHK